MDTHLENRRIEINDMLDGVVQEFSRLAHTTTEHLIIARYQDASRRLLSEAEMRIHPFILLHESPPSAHMQPRAVWSRYDHNAFFNALAITGYVREEFMVLFPERALSHLIADQDIVGALALDVAECLLDVPDSSGYRNEVDAVLAMRSGMASLLVGNAHKQGLLHRQAVEELIGQIRRDFVVSLQRTYDISGSLKDIRSVLERSPGLLLAVRDITNEAITFKNSSSPVSPDWLFDTAEELLQRHAPAGKH
jgi:hypothetical protein